MSFLLPCPSPKWLSLYSFTLANPPLSQYRSRAPAVFSAIGCGIKPALIHLRIVPLWTPSNLAVSEIENFASINLCTMMVCMSRTKRTRTGVYQVRRSGSPKEYRRMSLKWRLHLSGVSCFHSWSAADVLNCGRLSMACARAKGDGYTRGEHRVNSVWLARIAIRLT